MAIDTLAAPLHTKAFIAAALKATGKSFNRVVNTHHHSDHVLGNQFFLPAEIVGHEFCRQAVVDAQFGAIPSFWQKREGWADGTEVFRKTPPVTTFNDKVTYHYGDLRVELLFVGPAHTWGDVLIHVPQHKILFAADTAFYYVAPACQSAHVTKWIEVVDKIAGMDVETIVPGHGPIGGKKELAQTGEYLRRLKREAKKHYDAGMRPGQAAAEINMGELNWFRTEERIVTTVVRLYAEFNGTLTPVTDQEATRKAREEYAAIKKARGQ
jgi:glyoxylase-like metal-dependent hydrolase (beta-lactamase superfamily II)